jgi:hypothetical protein
MGLEAIGALLRINKENSLYIIAVGDCKRTSKARRDDAQNNHTRRSFVITWHWSNQNNRHQNYRQ